MTIKIITIIVYQASIGMYYASLSARVIRFSYDSAHLNIKYFIWVIFKVVRVSIRVVEVVIIRRTLFTLVIPMLGSPRDNVKKTLSM